MAHDVFISYSSENKAIADAVCAALESHQIRCWIAPRDVLPGHKFAQEIIEAVHSSRVFVLVFSSASNASVQVQREVDRAVSCALPILPLRVEDVVPSDWLEYYLAGQHWLDALTPPLERHLVKLCEAIAVLLGPTPPEALPLPEPSPPLRPVPPEPSPSPRPVPPEPSPTPRPMPPEPVKPPRFPRHPKTFATAVGVGAAWVVVLIVVGLLIR